MDFTRYQPQLAPYACNPAKSRGRCYPEPESTTRTVFQRDRDRIIHSTAFRRLEYKTQVFVNHEGDHYRTRLTHSLEVSQLARSMARSLGLNEDLAEAVALAHDLGHPPFGHAGEDALAAAMAPFGGFNHNLQALRILTYLEQRYIGFDGLNLSWEALEGIAKHNGPHKNDSAKSEVRGGGAAFDLELHTWPSAEAQVASLADDIAYHNHDIDDGLRANLITLEELFELPQVGDTFREVWTKFPHADRPRLIHESIRRLIHQMVVDILTKTSQNIKDSGVSSPDEIRRLGRPVAAFSHAQNEANIALKKFLMQRMYRHYKVNRMTSKARRVVQELFEFLHAEPCCLPPDWQVKAAQPGDRETARVVADFIAGMTDRFAFKEHRRLFDTATELLGGG